MPGKLITIEGHECSGKSTQIKMLQAALIARNIDHLIVVEPGHTELGNEIRELVKKPRAYELHPETELFLFQACRAQLVRQVLVPELQKDKLIICDRFFDSTWVYQGWTRGVNLLAVEFCNALATLGVTVDKTFLLRVPFEVVQARLAKKQDRDRIELNNEDFHRKVHEGYEELAHYQPERVVSINGDRTEEEVHKELLDSVLKIYKSN